MEFHHKDPLSLNLINFFFNKEEEHSTERLCFSKVPQKDSKTRNANELMLQNSNDCKEGFAYCWMGCLTLNGCSLNDSECYDSDHSQCYDNSMNPSCEWHCNESTNDNTSDFCLGATDMLMQGFQSTKNQENSTNLCIILFARKWTLSSTGKFAAGCVGVFFLGFLIEAIIALRRFILGKISLSNRLLHILVTGILYSVNLSLGYLAMLVAMTYSVELFICVILGLSIGNIIFNSRMPVSENIDPCCVAQTGPKQTRNPDALTSCDPTSFDDTSNKSTSSLVSRHSEGNGECCSEKL